MNRTKKILKYSLLTYLMYVFIFSFLIFSFHPLASNADNGVNVFSSAHENDRAALIETPEDLKEGIGVNFDTSLQVDTDYSYIEHEDAEVSELSLLRKMIIRILSVIIPVFEKLL